MNFKYYSVLLFFLFVLNFAFAAPGIPHQFYGTVTINGNAADNATITAKINGTVFGSTTSTNGTYGYSPNVFFVEDPDGVNNSGKTIEFFVNSTKVGESIFLNNGFTELNLALTVDPFCGDGLCNGSENSSSCSADCPVVGDTSGGGTGGGAGGGGGGGGLKLTVTGSCINEDVQVKVLLSNDRPANNTEVNVFLVKDSVNSGKTDSDGLYSFSLTEAGAYRLEVYKAGYLKVKKDLNLSDCSVSTETELPENTAEQTDLCADIDCNDGNPCTTDACYNGTCSYEALNGISCGDNSSCNAGECVSNETEQKQDDSKPSVVPSTGFFNLTAFQGAGIVLGILIIGTVFFFVLKKN